MLIELSLNYHNIIIFNIENIKPLSLKFHVEPTLPYIHHNPGTIPNDTMSNLQAQHRLRVTAVVATVCARGREVSKPAVP